MCGGSAEDTEGYRHSGFRQRPDIVVDGKLGYGWRSLFQQYVDLKSFRDGTDMQEVGWGKVCTYGPGSIVWWSASLQQYHFLSTLLRWSHIVHPDLLILLLLTGVLFAIHESALARPNRAKMASSFTLEFYGQTSFTSSCMEVPGSKEKGRMTVGPV